MNVGYESDELKPHIEPVEDYNDTSRIGKKLLLTLLGNFFSFLSCFPVYKHPLKQALAQFCLSIHLVSKQYTLIYVINQDIFYYFTPLPNRFFFLL